MVIKINARNLGMSKFNKNKKGMKKVLLIILGMFLVVSCVDKKTQDKPELKVKDTKKLVDGFRLLENNCFSCHNPNIAVSSKIAPSFAEIKEAYLKEKVTQTQFEEKLIKFINNPTKENSIVKGAIGKYGVMPKLSYNDNQIKAIAYYIYNMNVGTANWYKNEYQKEKENLSKHKEVLSPMQEGKALVMKTKSVLGKNLLGAIKSKGAEGALVFCSEKAVVLTDSMSVKLNAKIKRVSDKNRNPNNKATGSALEYILATKQILKDGGKPKPKLITVDGKQIKYYPIMTNKMCMQCHGKPKADIKPKTQRKIDLLYPNDKAFGYTENELRGIWIVETDK